MAQFLIEEALLLRLELEDAIEEASAQLAAGGGAAVARSESRRDKLLEQFGGGR